MPQLGRCFLAGNIVRQCIQGIAPILLSDQAHI